MVKLIRINLISASIASLLIGAFYLLFPSLFINPYTSSSQLAIVITVYIFFLSLLFIYPEFRVYHLLAIPILTQFLHLFQQYNFPLGANSIWRILPFICMLVYTLVFLLQTTMYLTSKEKLVLASWFVLHLVFLLPSANLSGIYYAAFVFYTLLPTSYLLLQNWGLNPPSSYLQTATFLFIIIAVGTLSVIYWGARYKGANNLLVTRNLSDTNITLAYFTLLWPFVLGYCKKQSISIIPFLALFVSVIFLSFSRGAMLLLIPYLFFSTLLAGIRLSIGYSLIISFLLYWQLPTIESFLKELQISYAWGLRLSQFSWSIHIWEQLQEESGRGGIQDLALRLFLEKPLLGHGINSFEALGPGFREAHSILFTNLAETGLLGTIIHYVLFTFVIIATIRKKYYQFTAGIICYLVYCHSVGSVWFILSSKSMTINCIAPLILLYIYLYTQTNEAHQTIATR